MTFRALLVGVVVVVVGHASFLSAACPPIDHTHGAWSAVLARFTRDARVDYAGLQRDPGALDAYLASLSAACATDYETWSREQRLAFWINAYNAFTVKLVVDHHPIASIRKIGWLPGAAFRRAFIPMPDLEGRTIALDDIEHRTLRRDFTEPRIHFALVCAARSCPPLRGEAYRAVDLDRQLDDQGRTFLRDPTKNRFDAAAKMLYLSAIFDWFRADFETGGQTLVGFVVRYLDEPAAAAPDVRITFLEYDWALNAQGTAR